MKTAAIGIAQHLLPGISNQLLVGCITRGLCLQWEEDVGNYWLSGEFNAKIPRLNNQTATENASSPFLLLSISVPFSSSEVYGLT